MKSVRVLPPGGHEGLVPLDSLRPLSTRVGLSIQERGTSIKTLRLVYYWSKLNNLQNNLDCIKHVLSWLNIS